MTLSAGQKVAVTFVVGGLLALAYEYVVSPIIEKPVQEAVEKAIR